MSLYIGKSNTGKKIIHITDGTISKSSISVDNPLASTIFHSSLPYIQPLKFSCTFSYRDINVSYPFGTRRLFYIKCPLDAINYVANGYEFFIAVLTNNSNSRYVKLTNHIEYGGWSSNKNVDSTLKWGSGNTFDWNTPGITDLPTATNNTLMMINSSSVLLKGDVVFNLPYNILNSSDVIYDAFIVVLNVKNNSIYPQLVSTSTSEPNSIKIDKNSFVINSNNRSIDMSNFTYLRRTLNNTGSNYYYNINTGNKCFYMYTDLINSYGWKIIKEDESYAIYKKLDSSNYTKIFSKYIPMTTYMGTFSYSILNNISFNLNGIFETSVFSTDTNYFYHISITAPSIKTYGHNGNLETTNSFKINSINCSFDDNSYGIVYVAEHLSIYSGEMYPRHSIFFIWAGVINGVFKIKLECKLGSASYNSSYIHTRLLSSLEIKVLKFYTTSITN